MSTKNVWIVDALLATLVFGMNLLIFRGVGFVFLVDCNMC